MLLFFCAGVVGFAVGIADAVDIVITVATFTDITIVAAANNVALGRYPYCIDCSSR